jgi:hypothetical protein
MKTDPRVWQLAEAVHEITREKATKLPAWKDLVLSEREKVIAEAKLWLRAAMETGIAPLAERPTDKHDAVWMDDDGELWAEYQTSPPTPLEEAAILPLVWASEECRAKDELEARGIRFRLIGWSK